MKIIRFEVFLMEVIYVLPFWVVALCVVSQVGADVSGKPAILNFYPEDRGKRFL
jgi:hypothetical protein